MADLAYKSSSEIFTLIEKAAAELYSDKSWAGLQEGSFEWLLAKIVAEVSAVNGQYLDMRALNAYIDTVITRRDARNIAENVGGTVRERSGATVELTIVASDEVTIPMGSQVSASNGEVFVTTSALTLSSATSLTGTVTAVHASYSQVTVKAQGNPGEVIELAVDNVLPDQLIVTVDATEWTKVDNWSASGSTDTHYRVSFDDRNRASIVFGNGVYGQRLAADSEVVVDVFAGGGLGGNAVDGGAITTLLSTFANASNVTSITNALAPSGGRAADSLETIQNLLPSSMKTVTGYVNPTDGANAIVSALSWCQDAVIQPGYTTTVSGYYVPSATVSALVTASGVQVLGTAKDTELATLLANKGELGVQWITIDPVSMPVEIEADLYLNNRNLANEKIAAVNAALVTDATNGVYAAGNLSFGSVHTQKEIVDAISAVDGVEYVNLKRFARIPQAILTTGNSADKEIFLDLELGDNAEDGYFYFENTVNDLDTWFYRPVRPVRMGADFVVADNQNWLVEEHSFDDGGDLNDTTGPYIKTNGSSKIEFKQLTRVWNDDQFNGSVFTDKHLLKITWVDSSDVPREAYYSVADTQKPGTIITTENAASPISGTAITTLANADYSTIKVYIVKSQILGTFTNEIGEELTVSHNSANTLYFTTTAVLDKIPLNRSSYLVFDEAAYTAGESAWIANSGMLRARMDTAFVFAANSKIRIYTSPIVARRMEFKYPYGVDTLSTSNITLKVL